MKRILYILTLMLTVGMGASAQTLIERSDGTFTQGDQYLAALKTLSIPYGVAPTFDGGLARNGSLFFNTTTNKLMIWTGSMWDDVGKDIDLTDYYNKSEVNALISSFATIADMNAALATKQGVITGAATSVVSNNLTANRAVISNGSGKIAVSPVTANELSYLGGVTSSVQAQLNDKIAVGQKGANNGVAPLNSSGKIPSQYVDVTTMEYMGTWNAATNEPVLSDATGAGGQYYRVIVGGTRNLGSGNITFTAGDDVIHNGTIWQRVPSTQLVTSVNGQTGNIVLGKTDVGLGSVDNTADLAKPISTATQIALDAKESLSNKATSLASPDNTKYPTTQAVANAIAGSIQTLSAGPSAGQLSISGGNSAYLSSLNVNTVSSYSEFQPDRGLHVVYTSGASGYPLGSWTGIRVQRNGGITQGSFEIGRTSSAGSKLYFNIGSTGNDSEGWRVFASEEWVQPLLDAKLNLTGGTVTGLITATTAPTAGGHLTNKTYVDNAISTAIAAAGGKAESVTVAATATYTLSWDAAKKAKFGDFGNFEVWLETGGTYKLATVPVSMTLSGGAASAYTFTLSNVNAIIVIK